MLSKTMLDALNDQINAEYYSSYLYLSMAAWAESANLKGFANWFRVQSLEEMVHVMKFFQYVLDRDGQVKLAPIGGPATQWDSPLAAFEAALAHERHITGRINNLAGLAIKENDHATHTLLEWFLNEQVEEEATAKLIVAQLKLAGDAPAALFMLDRELGARTLAPAAAGT
jgi:ferritin